MAIRICAWCHGLRKFKGIKPLHQWKISITHTCCKSCKTILDWKLAEAKRKQRFNYSL